MARFEPFSRKKARQPKCRERVEAEHCPKRHVEITLADVHPGAVAKITGFCGNISRERCSHFRAYGLIPGNLVKVIQHSPVTVIQIDHTELAMELELACEIQVEENSYLYNN
jgi:Fe2+ transport system protein FeoA